MNYLYLAIFVVFTSIHLFASLKKDVTLRAITKPVILLSLLGFYLESVPNPSWMIILALIFSWLGDVLLIPHGTSWFTAGGISFMASHIFFILGYVECTAGILTLPWFVYVLIGATYAALTVFVFIKLKSHLPKMLFFPMFVYLLINGAMNSFAWFRLISGVNLGTIVTAIGALLFFMSDCTLFFVRFKKNSKIKTHFPVMLTYSIGELLIILGLVIL